MPCSSGRTRAAPVTAFTQQGVAAAVPSSSLLAAITNFPRFDRTQWIGKDVSLGWPNSATSWQSDMKRYCRTMTENGTALKQELFQAAIEPRGFVDPSLGQSGQVIRISDMIRVVFTGAIAAQQAKANFMVGQNLEATNNSLPNAKIGFQCQYGVLNVQPNWFAYYSSFDGSVRSNIDTGVACNGPHLLTIELDASTNKVNWYIDGVLKATFSPAAGTAPGQNATTAYFPVAWLVYGGSTGGANNAKMDFLMGGVPLLSHQFTDT